MNEELYNQYIKLIKETTISNKEIEKAKPIFELIDSMQPQNGLYKFRKCDENSLEAFRENKLFFNATKNFNDPFDTLIYVNKENLKKVIQNADFDEFVTQVNNIKSYSEIVKKFQLQLKVNGKNETENSFEKIKNEIIKYIYSQADFYYRFYQDNQNISCFSENLYDSRMWAHYADSHKGFALNYSFEDLKYQRNGYTSTILAPIIYTNERFDATNYLIDQIMINISKTNGIEWPSKDILAMYKICLLKSKEWEYEKEWRLLKYEYLEKPYINIKPKAIYLGCRIKKCYEDILVNYAKKLDIKIYKMSQNENEKAFKFYANNYL